MNDSFPKICVLLSIGEEKIDITLNIYLYLNITPMSADAHSSEYPCFCGKKINRFPQPLPCPAIIPAGKYETMRKVG
jgi:hypothetical protein